MRKRAWATIQGFEGIRMLNKGQFDFWLRRDEPKLRVQERSAFFMREDGTFKNKESVS